MSDRGCGTGTALRRAAVAVALCYGIGAVATQAFLARQFSHSPGFVRQLGDLSMIPWLVGMGVAVWVVVLHLLYRRRGIGLIDGPLVDRAAPAIWALAGLSVAPFLTAYASHVTLPALALVLGAGLTISAALAPRVLSMGRGLAARAAAPFVVGGVAAGWYFAVSYYRHAQFGSGSRDMGLFLQSVWLISRGRSPQNTLIDIPSSTGAVHAFGDHMELIDFFVAPALWIWPDAGALLLVQAAVAGAAVLAVMRIAQRRTGDGLAALLFGSATFIAYPLVEAVQFDWNPTTMAAGFLALAFDAADRRRIAPVLVALALVGLCKENLWLYVAAFGIYLALEHRTWRLGLGVAGGGLVCFGVEMGLLFPLFREGGFRHFYFKEMGANLVEVALNTVRSPLRALSTLVTPGNKVNGLLLPLTSTAWLGLWAPAALVVAIPGVLERFLSSFPNAWWGHHYGAPMAVVATVAAIHACARLAPRLAAALGDRLPQVRASTLLAMICFAAAVLVAIAGRWAPLDLFQLEKSYLPPAEERPAMRRAVAAVPDDRPVAAQNYFVAHLATRPEIYELREHSRADVVVINTTTSPWPYTRPYVERIARQLAVRADFGLTFCEAHSWIFTRGAPATERPACPTLDALLSRQQVR